MGNPLTTPKRIVIISVLVLLCVALASYLQSIDIETVYTHIFYIPIVISCIWWERKGIIIAVLLGVSLIVLHMIFMVEIAVFNDLLRVMVFIIVAILVSEISCLEKVKGSLLDKEIKKSQANSEKIAEEKRRLKASYLGLALKNNELEEKHDLLESKDQKIAELEKQLKKLRKLDRKTL